MATDKCFDMYVVTDRHSVEVEERRTVGSTVPTDHRVSRLTGKRGPRHVTRSLLEISRVDTLDQDVVDFSGGDDDPADGHTLNWRCFHDEWL
jgi:hypothetical protein